MDFAELKKLYSDAKSIKVDDSVCINGKHSSHYAHFINSLIVNKCNFILEETGSSRTIYHNKTQTQFSKVLPKNSGLHIIKLVKNEILKKIGKAQKTDMINRVPDSRKKYMTQAFNIHSLMSAARYKDYIIGIDISSCYFTTLYKLGYISDKLYEHGMSNPSWKLGRNASIGSLIRGHKVLFYKEGVLVNKYEDKVDRRLDLIRDAVMNYVWDFFKQIINVIEHRYYMFLTDAIYISPDSFAKKEVVNRMIDNQWECVSKFYKLIDMTAERDERVVSWREVDDISRRYFLKGGYHDFNNENHIHGDSSVIVSPEDHKLKYYNFSEHQIFNFADPNFKTENYYANKK